MAEDNPETETSSSNVNSSLQQNQESIKAITKPQSQLIIIQLDDTNYLLWKFQIETAIMGYGLENYVLGSIGIPPKFITDKEGKIKVNPEHTIYQRQDGLISSWLLSSISSNLLPQLVGCKTSHEIWATIDQVFNTQSAARIMFYRRQLQNCKQDNLSIREYLVKIKTLCDQLASVGNKIPDSEQFLTILNGLNDEYEANSQQIQQVVAEEDFKKKNHNYQSGRAPHNQGRGGQQYRGRGRSGRWNNNNNRLRCQICEKFGHAASKCYFRLDLNYIPGQQSNNNNNARNYNVNLVNSQQGSTDTTEGPGSSTAKMEDIQDDTWYPDSGATNHVTDNLGNLNLGNKEYKG